MSCVSKTRFTSDQVISQKWLLFEMVYTSPEWSLWCKLEKVIFLGEQLEVSAPLV